MPYSQQRRHWNYRLSVCPVPVNIPQTHLDKSSSNAAQNNNLAVNINLLNFGGQQFKVKVI